MLIVPIRGMHCASCEILISKKLKKLPGVTHVSVSFKKARAEVQYQGTRPHNSDIMQAVRNAGYDVGYNKKLPWLTRNPIEYKELFQAILILSAIFFIAKGLNLFNLNIGTQSGGVFVALLVGLVAGISTCMALVGGLVLGLSARHAEAHPEATPMQKFRPHIYFSIGRIAGYAAFGALIGLLGQAFQPSANVLGILTMLIGGVMLFFGLKLIEIFPVLKNKTITLPSSISRLFGLQKEVKEYSHKTAMVSGALTFFMPCGFTQAMQMYAISTGNPVQGAMIMGLFALGTAPGLLGIGGMSSIVKGKSARLFFKTAGLAVIWLGIFNITNGSSLLNVNLTGVPNANAAAFAAGDVQEVRMTQEEAGYSPDVLTVVKGRPVKWIITSTSQFSCATSLIMSKYNISQILRPGENIITFTPTEIGEIPFSCSMGMYRGKFIVTDENGSVGAANTIQAAAPAPSGSSCGSGGCGCGGGARKPVQEQVGTVQNQPSGGSQTEQVIQSVYTYNGDIQPNTFTVKRGQPVRYIVDVKENGSGCMSTIMVPELYDNPEYLDAGRKIEMTFTPQNVGTYGITCAMGVPRGRITVEN